MKNWKQERRDCNKKRTEQEGSLRGCYFFAIFLTTVFSLPATVLSAQIQAPDFLCVTNDTLRWNAPNNTCGTFGSYLIYTSTDPNSTFTLLDSVTDPNQTRYYHQNAGTGRRFYFLQSRYNCPGQLSLSSDTLDNRIPEAPIIRFTSVNENGSVEIAWTPSPSPEAYAYIVSKNTASGTTIIDTVINGLTYLDTSARANERVETYFVVTLDRCGNTSLIPPPHSTLLLRTRAASACDRTVGLEWALYRNWQNPIEKHEIWTSENGGAPRKVGETTGTANTFMVQNIKANVEYCFWIQAIETGTGNRAVSSRSCARVNVVAAVTELVATNATVTPDNRVAVSWMWSTDAVIQNVQIQRSTDNQNFTTINAQTRPPLPLNRSNTLRDTAPNPSEGPIYYQIKTLDSCNVELTSNVVGTVFLESTTQGTAGNNLLRWTPYINANARNVVYELYRLEGTAAPVLVATLQTDTREYVDQVDLTNEAQATACYFVLAKAQVMLPDSTLQPIESRSNTACSSQDARYYIPNAFAPNGSNPAFRIYLQFGEPTEYNMTIYDRWGNLLFESRNFSEGWDGRSRGKEAPQGVYTYLIRFTKNDGKKVQEAGTVLLVR